MQTVTLPSGETVPALGMGTWAQGEQAERRKDEIAALQHGIELGMRLIDTAEMYGEGAAEELVGEAIRGRRDEVFLVSKVYPFNAGRRSAVAACEGSLQRLGVDCIDLYLLHWRGDIPFAETVDTFERLRQQGKIRHWGVSNLDPQDMQELLEVEHGAQVATNQVLYNLTRRGIEWDLQPWCRQQGIPLMAYSPLEQARLLRHQPLRELAAAQGMTVYQMALAWLLRQDGLIAIPKASSRRHVEENHAALGKHLDAATLAALDRIFPPPTRAKPLEML